VHLGLGALQVGLVLGAPVAVQLALGLFGGAAADRWGGRNILLQATLTMALGGLACIAASDFWTLLAAQLFFTYSRGVFWPASQALAAALPGERAVHLGRLNALTSIGQIGGTAGAGVLVAWADWSGTFLAFAAVSLAGMAAAATLPRVRPESPHGGHLFVHFGPLLRTPAIWFALLAAFLCAQPVSLAQSFFPILLRDLGFPAPDVGPLMALRPLGAAVAALVLVRLLAGGGGLGAAVVSGCVLAVCLALAPHAPQALAAGSLIGVIGIASGLLLVYYQLVVANAAPAHARGSALALGGAGWGISHLTGPFLIGAIAERAGLPTAFHVWAGFTLLLALALLPAYWIVRRAARVPSD
jgi:predicted MFS family arabinose efflux permease